MFVLYNGYSYLDKEFKSVKSMDKAESFETQLECEKFYNKASTGIHRLRFAVTEVSDIIDTVSEKTKLLVTANKETQHPIGISDCFEDVNKGESAMIKLNSDLNIEKNDNTAIKSKIKGLDNVVEYLNSTAHNKVISVIKNKMGTTEIIDGIYPQELDWPILPDTPNTDIETQIHTYDPNFFDKKTLNEYIQEFQNLMFQLKAHREMCQKIVNNDAHDQEMDFMHAIELYSYNAADGAKLLKQMHESRQHRRYCMDLKLKIDIIFCAKLTDWFDGTIARKINGINNRKYTPRALPHLFAKSQNIKEK